MAKATVRNAAGATAAAVILGGTLYFSGVLEVGDVITVGDWEGTVVALYNIDDDPGYDCVDLEDSTTGEIVRLRLEQSMPPADAPAEVFQASDFVIVPDDWVPDPENPCAAINVGAP